MRGLGLAGHFNAEMGGNQLDQSRTTTSEVAASLAEFAIAALATRRVSWIHPYVLTWCVGLVALGAIRNAAAERESDPQECVGQLSPRGRVANRTQ